MADHDWAPFQEEIRRLYILEDKPLPEVMDYMASKYSLHKSQQQYRRQFTKWGLRKIAPSADWPWIERRVEKRKRGKEGKESEVHIDGEQARPKKVANSKYREGYNTSSFLGAESPNTPDGVVVFTPATPGMHISWNGSLPWLQFIELLRPSQGSDAPSPSSSLVIVSPPGTKAISNKVNLQLMERLSSIIPWKKLQNPPNIHSSSRSSAALSILMPEEYDGQHDKWSIRFSTSKRGVGDRLAVELYLLSNNLTSHAPQGKSEESLRRHDSQVLEMLKDSGWDDSNSLNILLSTRGPTAESIAEKVFASVVRLMRFDILEIMLNAGMNPNGLIETIPKGILSPLQFAAGREDGLQLVGILISHKADVNFCESGYPALYYAIEIRHAEIANMLLSRGATVTPSCLLALAMRKDIWLWNELVQYMIESCPDVNSRTGWQDPSALVQAVQCENVFVIDLLLARGAEINELTTFQFGREIDLTTTIGLAVKKGNIQVIQSLLRACKDINPDFGGLPYISPLTLAVSQRTAEVVRALLDAGIDLRAADSEGEMTLLERAARNGDSSICSILIERGAKPDREPSGTLNPPSALLLAVKQGSLPTALILIEANARLNDEYSNSPGSVLGAAIESGQEDLIQFLINAGATLIGTKLQQIGSMQVAKMLQQIGLLPSILHFSGQKMLVTALLNGKQELAQFLFQNGAGFNGGMQGDEDDNSATPLEAAIISKNSLFVEALLNNGAKVTDGALESAIELMEEFNDDSELLQRLLARFYGDAPKAVIAALKSSSLESLQLLRDAKIDPTLTLQCYREGRDMDEYELSPPHSVLEIAVVFAGVAELKYLLEWTQWSAENVGRAVTAAMVVENYQVIETLLEVNCDFTQEITVEYPSSKDVFGNFQAGAKETFTPLQAAVSQQLVTAVKGISQKTDVNFLGKGVRRRTPLQLAVEKGNMEIFNILLTHGAKIDSPPAPHGGVTALQAAAIQGYVGIARRLLDLGADVNEPPARYFGRTALQGAAEHGRIDMLQLLLEAGTLIIGEGEEQFLKAVELAERNGHNAAARLLKSFKETVQLSPS
ncbi:hypothetical protein N7493_000990 [Penicillium malachiteum]|uniref:Clr5 domain-containing protein n=1 Tax=Penicillium malachiteum TaxID=1324776 RepID=A0AAD6N1A5_9EURO|nr:hypothetical protein N7493_000990 [Penicillium malachiteum]